MARGELKDPTPPPPPRRDYDTYRISFPWGARNIACPVGGFPFRTTSRSALWLQFFHCHMRYTVVIPEERIRPLPRCPKCDMFVTWRALNGKHQDTAMCARWGGAETEATTLRRVMFNHLCSLPGLRETFGGSV